jgi:hypothetical protein
MKIAVGFIPPLMHEDALRRGATLDKSPRREIPNFRPESEPTPFEEDIFGEIVGCNQPSRRDASPDASNRGINPTASFMAWLRDTLIPISSIRVCPQPSW